MSIQMCYVCDYCNQPFLFMAKSSYVSHLKLHAEDRIFIKKRNKIIEKNKRIKNEMSLYGIREAFEKILFDNCYHVIINFLRFDIPLVNSRDGEFNLDKNLLEKPEYKFLDLYIDNKTVVIEYEFKNLEVNIFSRIVHHSNISSKSTVFGIVKFYWSYDFIPSGTPFSKECLKLFLKNKLRK